MILDIPVSVGNNNNNINNSNGGGGGPADGTADMDRPRHPTRPVNFHDDRSLPAYHDPSYPDSLDFHLRSIYNNARELDASKARIRTQAESVVIIQNE